MAATAVRGSRKSKSLRNSPQTARKARTGSKTQSVQPTIVGDSDVATSDSQAGKTKLRRSAASRTAASPAAAGRAAGGRDAAIQTAAPHTNASQKTVRSGGEPASPTAPSRRKSSAGEAGRVGVAKPAAGNSPPAKAKAATAVQPGASGSVSSAQPASPVASAPVSSTSHRMVAQSTVSDDSRRDTLDLAAQARARVWMQREVAFIDHPSFRQRDVESVDEVLSFAAVVEDLPLQGELPEKLPPHLRRLCEVPLLTAEDERVLFRRMNFLKFQANVLRMRLREDAVRAAELDEIERLVQGAEKIRNRIIRANMRLVMSIVKHYISDSMAFDDLLSEGAAALLRAAEKFDCSRGFRFSTYVTKVVRREVFRLVMAHKRQSDRYATGAWDFIGEQSEERMEEVDNEVDLSALRGDLAEFFAKLDPREQSILRARFGMDHDDKAPSLNDLGRRMGVSKERVRQLEMRAIRKLQKHFQLRREERREAAAV